MRFFSNLFSACGKPGKPAVSANFHAQPPPAAPPVKHELTESMLLYLYEASSWLRFVGIILFIKSALLILTGLVFTAGILIAFNFTYIYDDYGLEFVGMTCVFFGFLFLFPARFVYNFAAKIRKFRISKKESDIELALKNNKSFWKFVGILCIVFFAFIPIFAIIAIIGGVFAAAFGAFL